MAYHLSWVICSGSELHWPALAFAAGTAHASLSGLTQYVIHSSMKLQGRMLRFGPKSWAWRDWCGKLGTSKQFADAHPQCLSDP